MSRPLPWRPSDTWDAGDLAQAAGFPAAFFLLTFAMSVPFWVLGAMARRGLPLPLNLPLSARTVVCPLLAATLVTFRRSGPAGVGRLLRRTVDPRSIRRLVWYLPVLGLMPLIMLASHAVMRVSGTPLPQLKSTGPQCRCCSPSTSSRRSERRQAGWDMPPTHSDAATAA